MKESLLENAPYFLNLARIEDIKESVSFESQGFVPVLVAEESFFLDLRGILQEDLQKELIEKEIQEASRLLQEGEKKLNNEGFRKNAREEIIEEIEERVASAKTKLAKLEVMRGL